MKNPSVVIHNVRMGGLATNSSSSHSLVFVKKDETGNISDNYDGRGEFGWDNFTLATAESKMDYLSIMLSESLKAMGLDDDKRYAILDQWVGLYPVIENDLFENGYIDHQSLMYIPMDPEYNLPDRGIFDELKNLLMREDVVIVGGNDNSEEDHPLLSEGFDSLRLTRTVFSSGWKTIVRKDEKQDFWTTFNTQSGTKVRFSFNDPGTLSPGYSDYDPFSKTLVVNRAATPELVDLKITDYCDMGCRFCAIAGTKITTPSGFINIEDISIGDEVITYNTDTNLFQIETVDQIFENSHDGDLMEIEMEDGTILQLTPNHEVYVIGKGWILAEYLEENDELINLKNDEKEKIR